MGINSELKLSINFSPFYIRSDMGNSYIINKHKYDDGFISIQRNQWNTSIMVVLSKRINNSIILTKELGEVLTYISTYKTRKIILSLHNIHNFYELYQNCGLLFFKILSHMGVKKIALITNNGNKEFLTKIVEKTDLDYHFFEDINESISWLT